MLRIVDKRGPSSSRSVLHKIGRIPVDKVASLARRVDITTDVQQAFRVLSVNRLERLETHPPQCQGKSDERGPIGIQSLLQNGWIRLP
jgi:hypothetical protein